MNIVSVDYGKQLGKIRNDIKKKLLPLLEDQDKKILLQLEKDLEETLRREYLTIAFIGEYSAGKSTLISALTGRRDLKISADIATDKCCEYEWNGIRLIDTPGLGTERQDHDEHTYEAIKKADLLVYCLTYSLFDTLTLENFKKLAFEQNYQTKMMLLVNKMSAEGGDDVEKRIGYYTESLKKSLEPDDLSQFPLVFCDARDQLEGEDEQDEELKKLSRFEFLTQELNKFVEENNITARLQTPLDMIRGCLNSIIENTSDLKDGEEQQHVISQLDGIIKDNKNRLKNELEEKLSDFKEEIGGKAEDLIQDIESVQGNIQGDITRLEQEIKNKAQALCNQMEEHLERVCSSLCKEIEGLEIKIPSILKNIEISNNISADTEVIDLKFLRILTKGIADFSKSLKGVEATAKTNKFVEGIGKLLGTSKTSQSWTSILARHASSLATISSIIDIIADHQEERRGEKIREAKRHLRNDFSNLAESYKNEFDKLILQILKELFGPIEKKALEMRMSYEKKQKFCNQVRQQAIALRDMCVDLSEKIQET